MLDQITYALKIHRLNTVGLELNYKCIYLLFIAYTVERYDRKLPVNQSYILLDHSLYDPYNEYHMKRWYVEKSRI